LVIENSNSVEVTEMNTTNKLFLPKGAHQLKFHYGDNQYIKDQLLENNVRVGAMFPNPVNRTAGDLTIAVSLPEGKNEVSMQLVNMLGNSFATSPVQTVAGGRQYITWKADLASVASGIYLVRIGVNTSMGQQRFEYRRIVIE
ncbi:MAG: T9SS type A sorting domain-containing protein, partial [Cyclobacteriaceae bacterium]|nr:T9SS type A sorting domain-containing protein [Cyclobacteriaceae bacterium]